MPVQVAAAAAAALVLAALLLCFTLALLLSNEFCSCRAYKIARREHWHTGDASKSLGRGAAAARAEADTDLDTVIRICPFRVFGNFSTLLNYRVSCLHSSSLAAASVAAASVVGRPRHISCPEHFSISPRTTAATAAATNGTQ